MFSKVDRHDLPLNINVCMTYLPWFSAISHTLDTSFSWLEPVLSFSHWEPNVATFISFVLKVHRHWESSITIGEEVREVFKESMHLFMLIMWEVFFMMEVIIKGTRMFSKVDRHDLPLNINVSVAYFSWFSAISHTFNASFSWLKPVFTFSHWEPNIAALISFILEVHWHGESSITIGEEIRKVFKESMDLLMLIMREVFFMMKVIIKRFTMLFLE
jgi:hypothetical protein